MGSSPVVTILIDRDRNYVLFHARYSSYWSGGTIDSPQTSDAIAAAVVVPGGTLIDTKVDWRKEWYAVEFVMKTTTLFTGDLPVLEGRPGGIPPTPGTENPRPY